MIKGTLFTQHFLVNGIKDYDSWKDISESDLIAFKENLKKIFSAFPVKSKPNEPTTERDLVDPTLKLLGWNHFLTQQTTEKKGRANVPDYLLFISEENKISAQSEKEQYLRYKHGAAIIEAKAWDIPLDRKANEALEGVPSNQILRYLTSVDVQSDGNIQWGILTNGRIWRLYYNRAKSKSEEFFEIDLAQALQLPGFQTTASFLPGDDDQDWLKLFLLFFQKDSFKKEKADRTFHEFALTQGKFWESKVADDLSEVVFTEVFPTLLKKIKENDPQAPKHPDEIYLKELRENTLTLLYRLLFILYAEDRNLLPVFDPRYDDYGLRKKIREDVAKRTDEKHAFSKTRDNYYHHVKSLFEAIDKGDESVGLPPYNGGLFDPQKSQLLTRTKLPDDVFAEVIDKLSRRVENNTKKWINYYDLSVQQLGSIYERLLEFHPAVDDKGDISVNPNIFARKTSGSYYTPETLVKLILEKTIGPLIGEKKKDFEMKIEELKTSKIKKGEKNKALKLVDPASEILNLKICDPAMGSGHFLVSLVDFLADHILETIDEAETDVPWTDKSEPYTSPVSERIISIRKRILNEAKAHNWAIKEEQLDDKHIVRRMILKRCVYGVDKNPMAVELAKVALWLHTFTVGAPLSFLDHHLRYGDSLFGEWISNVLNELSNKGTLISNDKIQGAKQAVSGMQKVEDMTDADIAEAKSSATTFNQVVEAATKPLNSFLSVYHALKWVTDNSKEDKTTINEYLVSSGFGDIVKIADGTVPIDEKNKRAADFKKLFTKAKALVEEEKFLNWELAYPGVWDKWESPVPTGGFDAVIGNPPWDRMKLQQVEWFSARKPEIAKATKASDREKMIKALEKKKDPLWNDFEKASWHAQTALLRARSDDQYPLLSTGDINLYSLFVERAHRLIKPNGIVGLLIPSGIAADKSASEFFKSISTEGRLAALYDFENKKVFFPDVDSRFKFCAYIAGGTKRRFDRTELAFFLHNTNEIKTESYTLSHSDFLSVNPNTGTAPVFRTKKDAEIVLNIYKNFPVLHNHSKGKVWPVKYTRMFDMTNDSKLFKGKEDLEKDGYYPVDGNKYKKGDEAFVPLYAGRMIHLYNHRFSSVKVNEENLHNAAISDATSISSLKDTEFLPTPQFWIPEDKIELSNELGFVISFRDIARSTDERTFITSLIPKYGVVNTLPIILPSNLDIESYKKAAPLIVANFSSLVFDYVARQKAQTTHLNWYIVEQLPVIPPDVFNQRLGKTTIEAFVKEQVLHLNYTASDMKPLAIDMGYKGKPFVWNEEDRRHRKAKLDALFFNLYNISEDDADYILNTFPIVKKDDEQEFGCYLTRDLILAYMRALKAGDTETVVKLK